MALGYVQARYRYSAWTTGLEAELEDVFVIREARRSMDIMQLSYLYNGRKKLELCAQMGYS